MKWVNKVLFINFNKVLLLRMSSSNFQVSEDMEEFLKNKEIALDKIIRITNNSMIQMEINSKVLDTIQLVHFMQRLKWQVIKMRLLFLLMDKMEQIAKKDFKEHKK